MIIITITMTIKIIMIIWDNHNCKKKSSNNNETDMIYV
jgi:hypothetical protein